jgi:hypothetical protein
MKIKFVFEAYEMKAQSISPIGQRLMSMKESDYVTVPLQVVFDTSDVDGHRFPSQHIDQLVLSMMNEIERKVRDDVRKALGMPSKREEIEAHKAAMPQLGAA